MERSYIGTNRLELLIVLGGIRETIMHGFWECPTMQKAWRWCKIILNYLVPVGEDKMEQEELDYADLGNISKNKDGIGS